MEFGVEELCLRIEVQSLFFKSYSHFSITMFLCFFELIIKIYFNIYTNKSYLRLFESFSIIRCIILFQIRMPYIVLFQDKLFRVITCLEFVVFCLINFSFFIFCGSSIYSLMRFTRSINARLRAKQGIFKFAFRFMFSNITDI